MARPDTPPAAPRWTDAQRRGITTTGRSLLVSAAAGSGKTAVLAERCAHLVCDADDPCDVDELLVVTFTEAAADEMRARIGKALRARAAAAPSERLAPQLALLDRASIGTLHGFCSRLLRQYFHLVGLDPAFSVLDADEARLLRTETARQLMDDRYELDEQSEFQRLVDAYGDGDDARVIRLVLKIYELQTSLVDEDAWMEKSLGRLREAAEAPTLSETDLGRELQQLVASGLAAAKARCAEGIGQLSRLGDFRKYKDLLQVYQGVLETLERVRRESGTAGLAASVASLEFPRLPPVRNDVPNKDAAKATVDAVRDAVNKGPWRDCLRFTPEQWQDGLRRVLPHAQLLLSLVKQFEQRYREVKDASRVVDFSDLERFALRALRDPNHPETLAPSAAARAQHRRFRHVLVDEYQDINEVQDAILRLVSRECLTGEPGAERNLFSVGDVKQSIYRFRLAEPGRFLERERLFRSDESGAGEVIDLQANFRSRAPLLEAVNRVFERLMTAEAADLDYVQTHRLHAGKQFPPDPHGVCCFAGAPIELHVLPKKLDAPAEDPGERKEECDDDTAPDLDRAEREALLVARRIREMMGLDGGRPMCVMESSPDGGMSPRPLRFGDVVVLLRAMRHKADEYAEVLESAGIPVHSDSSTGYFESTEVRDVLALLALLDNPRQDVPLAAVLRGPLTRLPEPENSLARIRIAYPAGEQGVPFHDAARRYAAERDDDLARWLRGFNTRLGTWRAFAQRRPLPDLLWKVYDDTGLLAYCGALRNGRQRVANLNYLHERATQFASFHRQGLARFLRFLDSLREEADLGQAAVATEAEDVVRIMSVHRSKGLEFPVVVLPDLGKAINLQDCTGGVLADRNAGLGMVVVDDHKKVRYPSLASTLVRQRLRQQSLAEELRILYVAMTRAKEHLILIGTDAENAPDKWAARWSGHEGPLPADEVLAARTLLDWIGPVWAATRAGGVPVFETTAHPSAEVAAWEHPGKRWTEWSERQQRLAELRPIDPEPESDALTDEVFARITAPHRFARFTAQEASRAMGSGDGRADSVTLAQSALLSESMGPSADELGAATHALLQHLDFDRDVAAQVDELVERRVLSSGVSRHVDVEGIRWFLGTELGRELRRNAKALLRELPIYAAEQSTSVSGYDCVMLRGRVDVLLPLADESVLVDYKTDAGADVEAYRPQVEAYADAVRRMTGKSVRPYVVLLRARRVCAM